MVILFSGKKSHTHPSKCAKPRYFAGIYVQILATVGGNYNLLLSGSVGGTIHMRSRGSLESDKNTCWAVIKAHSKMYYSQC